MASGTIANQNAYTSDNSVQLSGFASPLILERIGRICFVTYNGNITSMAKGDVSFSQVLPAKFRPSSAITIATNKQSTGSVTIRLLPTGAIDGYNYASSAITSATSARFGTTSYIAAN